MKVKEPTKNIKKKIAVKKQTTTNKKQNIKKKAKGFTLIELLAVIIILGVLMIIAIPSVTTYISNSRKESYIDTAKEVVGGAKNLVNSGKLDIYDTNTTYYIPVSCIPTENGTSSPYGDFDQAYVIVGYTGDGYVYYWASTDVTKQGIEIKPIDKLTSDDVKSGIEMIDTTIGVDNRMKIRELDSSCDTFKETINASKRYVNGSIIDAFAIYPEGKDKSTVELGDMVKIGTEEFYVLGRDGDNLNLLAKDNLKVGNQIYVENYGYNLRKVYSSQDEGYGIQSDSCIGDTRESGPGPRIYDCTIAYDETVINGILNNYKDYLANYGATIKDIRLMLSTEKNNLPYDIIYKSSYWLGDIFVSSGDPSVIAANSPGVSACDASISQRYGVRPVIVI